MKKDSALWRLARRHHVETSHVDAAGRSRDASDETVMGVLRALGEPIEHPSEAQSFLDRELEHETRALLLPAVLVAWDGEIAPVVLGARDTVAVELALEDGGDGTELVRLEARGAATVLVGHGRLPHGIHELTVSSLKPWLGRVRGERPRKEPHHVKMISSPSRAPAPSPRTWGVFAPTYGLTDDCSHDGGHLGCLERFGVFAGAHGASYVATLPILAAYSRGDDPDGQAAPYSPVSRMWWNEGYLDPAKVPELALIAQTWPDWREAVGDKAATTDRSAAVRCADAAARASRLRPILPAAARLIDKVGGARRSAYTAFLAQRPGVVKYARFRAACEKSGTEWRQWPARWRAGVIEDHEIDAEAVSAHLYAQFATDAQIAATAAKVRASGAGIMLDLPVGCRGDGFDPWAYPQSFASGATIGAPPDIFFSSGQDWGFPPLHPEGERCSGYEVTSAALRHLLGHAAALRLDHAAGLARLWWIPDGMSAAEGAYVRYRPEELIALCCLEASRRGVALMGEDLGTVEASLTTRLSDHGIAGMHVAVFDLDSDDAHPMEPLSPKRGSMALVDTHDTATFAAWFTGLDILERARLQPTSSDDEHSESTRVERARRARAVSILVDRLVASHLLSSEATSDPEAVHEALCVELAQSKAGIVMLNIEDCWAELDPQNVPGTTTEHLNFCRMFQLDLPRIENDERVLATFRQMRLARPRRTDHDVSDERAR
ncbi:MAG: 4-alpha-glucanotransferase [Acidimicrobiales bacterium]